ncbi:hypothetical protein HMPREF0044_0476 [Gleimia coleocanis DSM 15436]|uniref:Uncharacterized protein n=1 Tax=Gleimia coleocanis DSM 15436 TaxID=525245 RepID=C0VZ86_9ACTO|nr:hypothetical protein [Gleimia coleocanis]EEH64187.1 hypothetical protein HMPREF0044_0476 [Gleimia coleocanis DSM 15436]
MKTIMRALAATATAAVTTVLVQEKLRFHPALQRTNHAGNTVTLATGPALSAGLVAGNLVAGNFAAASALAATGTAGLYDDVDQGEHDGEQIAKGLKGHFNALRNGYISTGVLKVAVIGASAGTYALYRAVKSSKPVPQRVVECFVDTALIAGCANLGNLFDLRPGRALKVAVIASILNAGVAGAQVSLTLATMAVVTEEDLAGKAMLGDAGANPLGMMVGMQSANIKCLPVKTAVCGLVVGLNVLSEKVSFTKVIENTPVLHKLDMLGRN